MKWEGGKIPGYPPLYTYPWLAITGCIKTKKDSPEETQAADREAPLLITSLPPNHHPYRTDASRDQHGNPKQQPSHVVIYCSTMTTYPPSGLYCLLHMSKEEQVLIVATSPPPCTCWHVWLPSDTDQNIITTRWARHKQLLVGTNACHSIPW